MQQVIRIVNEVKVQYNVGKNTTIWCSSILRRPSIPYESRAYSINWTVDMLNFLTYITKLVYSFQTGRSLQVCIINKLSILRNIRVGVPQGLCLLPKLYNLYVSNFLEFLNTKLAKYTDDTAMRAHSYNAQAANMRLTVVYCDKWRIRISTEKSKVFTGWFAENKILTPISIRGRQIPTKRCAKNSRVKIDQRLTSIQV